MPMAKEVVGGIVVMRYGENADKVSKVKLKMKEVRKDCLKEFPSNFL
jgi:Cu/Ag efflux pump CusA